MMNSRRLAQRVENIINIVIKIGAYAGITILILMMLLTVVDVFMRYAFNRPITGGMEITEVMLITVSFLAIAYCAMEDGMVKMDFFVQRFPLKGQLALEIVGYIFCLALTISMTCLYVPTAMYMQRVGERSAVLDIPAFPFYWVVFFGCLMLSLAVLVKLVKSIVRLVK